MSDRGSFCIETSCNALGSFYHRRYQDFTGFEGNKNVGPAGRLNSNFHVGRLFSYPRRTVIRIRVGVLPIRVPFSNRSEYLFHANLEKTDCVASVAERNEPQRSSVKKRGEKGGTLTRRSREFRIPSISACDRCIA